jgi:hypothetical protein
MKVVMCDVSGMSKDTTLPVIDAIHTLVKAAKEHGLKFDLYDPDDHSWIPVLFEVNPNKCGD